jgi:hypothetical protein
MKQLNLFPPKQYVVRFTTRDKYGNPRLCGSQAYDSFKDAYQSFYTLRGNAFILEDSITIHAENYWVGH